MLQHLDSSPLIFPGITTQLRRLHHDTSLGLGERRGKPLLSTPLSFYQDITASPVLVAELWGPPLLPHLVPDPEPC